MLLNLTKRMISLFSMDVKKIKNNAYIVKLEDGTEVTSKSLHKELGISMNCGYTRIIEYFNENSPSYASEIDLLRAKNARRENIELKEPTIKWENPETHYEDGTLRMYVDPFWKVFAKL